MFALEALRHVDLDRGWHGYVKTVVRRRLVEHVHKLSEARTGEWSKGAEVLYPEQEFEGPVELVRRRVAARRALDELRERLSPAARQVLDLTIHPPFALLVMARNEEGRVVEPQCRHMAKFTGLPRRQVRQARIEIWKKSHRVAA